MFWNEILPAREAVTSFAKTFLLNERQHPNSFRCNCMATWRMENKENRNKAKTDASLQIPASFIQAEKKTNKHFNTYLIQIHMPLASPQPVWLWRRLKFECWILKFWFDFCFQLIKPNFFLLKSQLTN